MFKTEGKNYMNNISEAFKELKNNKANTKTAKQKTKTAETAGAIYIDGNFEIGNDMIFSVLNDQNEQDSPADAQLWSSRTTPNANKPVGPHRGTPKQAGARVNPINITIRTPPSIGNPAQGWVNTAAPLGRDR